MHLRFQSEILRTAPVFLLAGSSTFVSLNIASSDEAEIGVGVSVRRPASTP